MYVYMYIFIYVYTWIKKIPQKQNGNHEPESLYVLRRWIDHNKMTALVCFFLRSEATVAVELCPRSILLGQKY